MKQGLLFKNINKQGNQPDWRMVAKDGDNLIDVGALWIAKDEQGNQKQDKNGNPYMTLKMNDAYGDKAGYEIHREAPENGQNGTSNAQNPPSETQDTTSII